MLVISCFLTPQHLMMNVGNHGVGIRNDGMCGYNIPFNLGDDGVCVCKGGVRLRDTIANVRDSYIDVQPKFRL